VLSVRNELSIYILLTRHARSTREIKSWIFKAKAAFNKKKGRFTSKIGVIYIRKKLVKCYFCRVDLYVAETWTLRKINQKYL
jgi:hypothetical protein